MVVILMSYYSGRNKVMPVKKNPLFEPTGNDSSPFGAALSDVGCGNFKLPITNPASAGINTVKGKLTSWHQLAP
jgi:hypothetical protein